MSLKEEYHSYLLSRICAKSGEQEHPSLNVLGNEMLPTSPASSLHIDLWGGICSGRKTGWGSGRRISKNLNERMVDAFVKGADERGVHGYPSKRYLWPWQCGPVSWYLNFEGGWRWENSLIQNGVDAGTHEVGFGQRSLSSRLVWSRPTPPGKPICGACRNLAAKSTSRLCLARRWFGWPWTCCPVLKYRKTLQFTHTCCGSTSFKYFQIIVDLFLGTRKLNESNCI